MKHNIIYLNTFKEKIYFLIPITIIVLIIITTALVNTKKHELASLNRLEDGITLVAEISKLLHSLQKERGLTAGYISSDGTNYKVELQAQRELSDSKILKLKEILIDTEDKTLQQYIQSTLDEYKNIINLRVDIDSLSLNTLQTINIYTDINDRFLKKIKKVTHISQIPIFTKSLISFVDFLYAKETTGIQRAIGTMILSNSDKNQDEIFKFNQLIAIEKLHINNFFENTTKIEKDFYIQVLAHSSCDEIRRIKKIILNSYLKTEITDESKYWFTQMTIKINHLKLAEDYLTKNIIAKIQSDTKKTKTLYQIFLFLNILSVIIFSILILIVLKKTVKEKKLKDLTNKYIINSTTDTKGKITYASDAFCKISGYTREELLGKAHNITRHPDMSKEVFADMWSTISSGKGWTGTIKNRKKDGGFYWVYANIEPLFNEKGKIEAYMAIRLDITNSKQLEEDIKEEQEKNKLMDRQLMQQSRLAQMGEMISMIAHQWRQPLSAISATSVALELRATLGQTDNKYILKQTRQISNYAQHLSSTIDDFRNFFKSNKEKGYVSYDTIIDSVMSIVEVSIENQNITIVKDIQSKAEFETYSNELKQVILNLIKNAEDILLEKNISDPYIKIATYSKENEEILEISDNGGGIPKEIIDKIFDPYFSTKLSKNGTGLGLYMSKTIIEDHCHGRISVYNTKDGVLFKIALEQ